MRELFDSTSAADIPAGARMVAGYVDGRYAWSAADWWRFPLALKVRIACFPLTTGAHVYDVETGDLTPAQVPPVLYRERAAGRNPSIYVNRSNINLVRNLVVNSRQAQPLYWLSTLDGSQPWAPGIVAIQVDGANRTGGHYDRSVVLDYWPGVDSDTMPTEQQWNEFVAWVESNIGAKADPADPSVMVSLERLKADVAALKAAGPAAPQHFDLTVTPRP